jgi:hypothetical protein
LNAVVGVLFPILFVAAIIWLYSVWSLFRQLKARHPEKYSAMGEPSLFLNNTPRGLLKLLAFLFKREDRPLQDPHLSHLTTIMLILFWGYLVLFLFLFLSVLLGVLTHRAP